MEFKWRSGTKAQRKRLVRGQTISWPLRGVFFTKDWCSPRSPLPASVDTGQVWFDRRSLLLYSSRNLICPLSPNYHERLWLTRQCSNLEISRVSSVDRVNLTLARDKTPVLAMDVESTDNQYLLTASAGGAIDLMDLEEDASDATLDSSGIQNITVMERIPRSNPDSTVTNRGHSKAVTDVQWFPFHNGLFASCSLDGSLVAWDPNNFQAVHRYALHQKALSLNFSPTLSTSSSLLIACGLNDGTVRLCDLRSKGSAHTLLCHNGSSRVVKWSPRRAHQLYSASDDGSIKVWDVRSGSACLAVLDASRAAAPLEATSVSDISFDSFETADSAPRGLGPEQSHFDLGTAHSGRVIGLCVSQYEDYLYSIGSEGRVKKWDMMTLRSTSVNFGTVLLASSSAGKVQPSLADCPNVSPTPTLLVPCPSGAIHCFNAESGRLIQSILSHFKEAVAVVSQPRNTHYRHFSAGQDGLVIPYTPKLQNVRYSKSTKLQDVASEFKDDWSDA